MDGTPAIGDVYAGGVWKTMLVAGLNAGESGYYALDITNPVPPTAEAEIDVAAKVMWEFPNASTSATVRANIGLTFGRPVLAKTATAGWVALVTSGYNNTVGDGKGYLFVLNAGTGALIKAIATTAGSQATPSGLGQIAAYAESGSTDATIDSVYGGDLLGNLWRFDLTGPVNSWAAVRLASFTDAASNPQPISAAPELVVVQNRRLAVFGAIVFATNQPLPTACNAMSFIYVVDAAHGGQLPAAGFLPNETPWSGKQLGASFAAQPVIAMLASGTIEALTRGSDNSLSVTRLPLSASSKLRRITWKEILR